MVEHRKEEMKTFTEQLQEAVGAKYPLDTILANLSSDEILEEVNIFAKEVAKEALKNASENATYILDANDEVHIVKSSITSEENIPSV